MNKKYFWIITTLILLVMGIFFNGTSLRSSDTAYSKVYFEDHFNNPDFTFYYWGGRQCIDETHEDQNYVNLTNLTDGSNKLGYCDVNDGVIHFITQAFDIRGNWDLRGPEGARYAKKGGGEIAPGFRATSYPNSAVNEDGDSINIINAAINEDRKAVIQNGQVIEKGWDYTGESYLAENHVVKYHYRFKIDDVSLFEEGLSERSFIFQQHTTKNNACRDDSFTYEKMVDGVSETKRHDSMAPTAAMILVKENNGDYMLKFTTKTRDQLYYRNRGINSNGELKPCINGEDNLPICSLVLYQQPFNPLPTSEGGDLGKWYNVTVEMKIAKQINNEEIETAVDMNGDLKCENPDESLPNGSYADYRNCRPSKGYLSLIIDGERKTGNGNQLPWIQGRKYFRGVTTQFNDCPSYTKIGHYALNIDYEPFDEEAHKETMFDVKFDSFKITNKN